MSKPKIQTPEVLTAHEVAALIRVSRNTFSSMRRRSEIPEPFIGGRYPRWSRAQIDAWLARRPSPKG